MPNLQKLVFDQLAESCSLQKRNVTPFQFVMLPPEAFSAPSRSISNIAALAALKKFLSGLIMEGVHNDHSYISQHALPPIDPLCMQQMPQPVKNEMQKTRANTR